MNNKVEHERGKDGGSTMPVCVSSKNLLVRIFNGDPLIFDDLKNRRFHTGCLVNVDLP